MPERKDKSPITGIIATEIATLLDEGCVLTTQDFDEIASKHGFRDGRGIWTSLHLFGSSLDDRVGQTKHDHYYQIQKVIVLDTKYRGRRLFLNADLTKEETEWDEIIKEIDSQIEQAISKGKITKQRKLASSS